MRCQGDDDFMKFRNDILDILHEEKGRIQDILADKLRAAQAVQTYSHIRECRSILKSLDFDDTFEMQVLEGDDAFFLELTYDMVFLSDFDEASAALEGALRDDPPIEALYLFERKCNFEHTPGCIDKIEEYLRDAIHDADDFKRIAEERKKNFGLLGRILSRREFEKTHQETEEWENAVKSFRALKSGLPKFKNDIETLNKPIKIAT